MSKIKYHRDKKIKKQLEIQDVSVKQLLILSYYLKFLSLRYCGVATQELNYSDNMLLLFLIRD